MVINALTDGKVRVVPSRWLTTAVQTRPLPRQQTDASAPRSSGRKFEDHPDYQLFPLFLQRRRNSQHASVRDAVGSFWSVALIAVGLRVSRTRPRSTPSLVQPSSRPCSRRPRRRWSLSSSISLPWRARSRFGALAGPSPKRHTLSWVKREPPPHPLQRLPSRPRPAPPPPCSHQRPFQNIFSTASPAPPRQALSSKTKGRSSCAARTISPRCSLKRYFVPRLCSTLSGKRARQSNQACPRSQDRDRVHQAGLFPGLRGTGGHDVH